MKAIFLDKDGTLIEDLPYNIDPRTMMLTRGAGAGLRILTRLGYRLLVVSNQSGVARGYFLEAAMPAVQRHLTELLEREQVRLAGFYYCPHHPDGTVPRYSVECDCRKPMPGMLLRAAAEQEIDLAASWMIGDILDDIEAGKSAGCRTILIANGNETEWHISPQRIPDFIVPDLHAAALRIEKEEQAQAGAFMQA